MDIQYVTDAYSCMMYIVSYISKAEREMGVVIEQARKEALEENLDAQKAMKKIGGAYLHQREISAQEACFRVCGLKLKGCSRKVEFIPVGENVVRMSKPLKLIQSMSDEQDENDMWMTSSVDRYKARPISEHFETMCLATFCSEYRVVYTSQIPKKARLTIHQLQNNLGFIQKRSRTDNAVIRYPRFSVTKTPEQYYLTQLQLYLPHRTHSQLKPDNFVTYSDFYQNGAIRLTPQSAVTLVHEIVEANRLQFDKYSEEFDHAEELMEKIGPLEDAWAQICPEAEAERLECQAVKPVENVETCDDEIPDLVCPEQGHTTGNTEEIQPGRLQRQQIFLMLRTLNFKQREIFFQIRQYCIDLANGKKRDPFQVFITGGAGTGKSHLIKCIYFECQRILAPTMPNPDDTSVLILAPTGTAAFNVNGNTIHSALSIGRKLTLPCVPLSDEKINTLRSKLGSLQIVIIDEVSMVGKTLLEYIHNRLKQIKKTSDEEPFGNISIIAVGDFFQLPPVKGKPLYRCDPARGRDLWLDYFTIASLDEIMRQRGDAEFAQLLNRLRVRQKNVPINDEDLNILKSRDIEDYPSDVLHAYATNLEVSTHNQEMLEKNGHEIVSIAAKDFHKDPRSGKMKPCETPYKTGTDYLPDCLQICQNARVMLVRNLDVQDGLVNGAVGTVIKIIQSEREGTVPAAICVKFDNEKVGLKSRQSASSSAPSETVIIEPYEEGLHIKQAIRRQFPLVLCWACTIHKTQGLTTDHICANIEKASRAGMAYVVLSRATSLQGLYIKGLKPENIFCDNNITTVLANMRTFELNPETFVPETSLASSTIHIVYHNVQGLLQHKADIEQGTSFLKADVVCLTETWLQQDIKPQFKGFIPYLKSRFDAFDQSTDIFKSFKTQIHGGVGIYGSEERGISSINLEVQNIEVIGILYEQMIAIFTVYRPNSYPSKLFCQKLGQLLLEIDNTGIEAVIITGDFNENLMKGDKSVLNTMVDAGYTQVIQCPTTEGDTLIDHVYIKGIDKERIRTKIQRTYFSFHEAIEIFIDFEPVRQLK